jgi:hypothetical protein
MEIFSDISVAQWVIVGVGLLIAAPAFFPLLQGLWNKIPKPDPKPEVPDVPQVNDDHKHGLTELVCKWECLADACHEAGLHDACSVLDEVFPLLIGSRGEHEGG